MPVGEMIGWNTSSTFMDNFQKKQSIHKTVTNCIVSQEMPASTVAANLSGTAKKFICDEIRDEMRFHYTGYYLINYSWFLEISTDPNGFFYSQKTIKEIR
jgi:hypothetical protein